MELQDKSEHSNIIKDYIKKTSVIPYSERFYNYELRLDKMMGVFTFSVVDGWSYDYYLGQGHTVDEAMQSMKKVSNCYDKYFNDVLKRVEEYELVSLKPHVMK